MQKLLYVTLKTILAITFIFSGFVKGVEPMGTAIKVNDYFIAFNLEWLSFLSPVISVILPAIELLLGLLLLVGIYKRVVGNLVLIFMVLFTGLTFYINIYEPVSDCGCFGDALILTNEQTLYKNIVLLVFAICVCIIHRIRNGRVSNSDVYVRYVNSILDERQRSEFKYFLLFALFSIFTPIYAYFYHPAIEFLPYKVGVNINKLIEFKSSDSVQEPLMLYRDKETQNTHEFKLSDTEWQDTLKWEFVKLVDNIKVESVVSFDVIDEMGDNVAREMLNAEKPIIFIVSRDIYNSEKHVDKIQDIVKFAKDNCQIAILTTSGINEAKHLLNGYDINKVAVYNMDDTMIKSFVRAEVGLVVVDNATVLSKHNMRTIFGVEDESDFNKLVSEQTNKKVIYIMINLLLVLLICVPLFISRYRNEEN
ncbi:MAG: hypothetical protein R3Y26_07875 [Rikenellaceae bacterium]